VRNAFFTGKSLINRWRSTQNDYRYLVALLTSVDTLRLESLHPAIIQYPAALKANVDALPSVSPIDSRPSVVRSCVSSSFESHESPLPGSAFPRDPCPLLCPSCRIGSRCLCSSGRHPGTSSDQEILALTDHLDSSHDFHLIGLSSSPSDGSRLASSYFTS
jgi:hypothetical protein